ncbi:hypothetical protein FLLO111716_08995 [Flavobacterium longum]|uniref:hypothetical protein n=1 Tax=Flavobacterium longum TaxID=1299340 RepID=UPI0039EA5386
MRNLYILLLLLLATSAYPQLPQGISYQGLARSSSGTMYPLDTIAVRITIVNPGSSNVYREVHHPDTDALSIYSLVIGQGVPETGPGLVPFDQINWSSQNKDVRVEIDFNNGSNYSHTTQTSLLTVPYALHSKTAESVPTYTVKNNLTELKAMAGTLNGQIVFVKGHTNPGDGGGGYFMWKTNDIFKTSMSGIFSQDNNGTIIQAVISGLANDSGRWVRQYEGYINAAYFGAFGTWGNYTTALKNAIDFAKSIVFTGGDGSDNLSHFQSNTIYIPNGNYIVDKITLLDGVSIIGESMENTNIYPSNTSGTYLVDMEIGRVRTNVSNLNFIGSYSGFTSPKGVFYLKGIQKTGGNAVEGYGDGGLWNCTFKNIQIRSFEGTGIYLGGGTTAYNTPDQFVNFENVRVSRGHLTNNSYALFMEGQNGQYTYTNCSFYGGGGTTFAKGKLVYLKGYSPGGGETWDPAVVTFLNCTFSNADYGAYLEYAESISFDNCAFSNLGYGVYLNGANKPNKAVNVLNSRFDNAAGYGSYTPPSGYVKDNGACVFTDNSVVNVTGNYVTAGSFCATCNFVAAGTNNIGVGISGNTFSSNSLNKTSGVQKSVSNAFGSLSCKRGTLFFLNTSTTNIDNISSTVGAGEILTFVVTGIGNVKFNRIAGNIYFPGTSTTLTVNTGEVVQFRRSDLSGVTKYELVSLVKNNP